MSQAADLERGEEDGHCDLPQPGTNQLHLGDSDFQDSSRPLFSMYLGITGEEDKTTTERWKKDADVILIFTGLFSAAVATLLTVTVLDLKPSSQDTFYLANIQQLLADPSASIHSQPPPFSPPVSVILANVLLFLSLLISLTCALLATLLHQWARRFVRFTQQPGYSPHKRARIRAFFSRGVEKCHVPLVVEALPTLLHLSICLFFAGLIVWLFSISQPVFRAVVSWSALCAVIYLWFTFLPIIWPNSPCYAPLSPVIWSLYTGMSYIVLSILSSSKLGASRRFDTSKKDYCNRFSDGIEKTAAHFASKLSPEIDVRILITTLDGLGEDGARAKFFEAIPGFFNSERVNVNLLQDHLKEFRIKFGPVLTRYLDRTLSSNLVPHSVKCSQLIICLDAAHKVLGPEGVSRILYDILNGRWRELLESVEMAHSLRRWGKSTNETSPDYAHFVLRIVTQVIVGVRERNDHWISLVVDEFDVPDQALRANINHGDGNSLSLSLLTHITRRANRSGSWTPFILSSLTDFDVRNTLPELQRDFCALWNELVQNAWRDGPDSTALKILREIRHTYIGLHQGTEAAPIAFSAHTNHFNPVLAQPLSYRFCNIPNHRPDWTPRVTHLAVPSPTRPGFGSSIASTTQLGDSPNASPRSTSLEIQGLPRNADIFIISPKPDVVPTAMPQAEEANITQQFFSSVDLTMMRSDHSPSLWPATLSSNTGPLYITQRVLPVTDPPVLESTRGFSPHVSIGPSQRPFQSSPFVGDTDANSLHAEDPTPDPSSSDTRENPQAPAVVPLPSPHPDADPIIIDPSTDPGPLSSPLSVPDPDHAFEASQRPSWAITLPSPPESDLQRDIATPWPELDISEISATANPMPQSSLSGGVTLPKSGEVTAIPAQMCSDPQLSPIATPVIHSGEIPAESPSSVDSAINLSDHTSHTLDSPPESSMIICSRNFPWPSSVLYSPVMPRDGDRAHVDASEMEHSIPMVVLSDTSRSSPLALDIGARTKPDVTLHG